MARRSVDWNEGLSKDLRNKRFAREFILAGVREGLTLQQVLGKVIRSYGVKEHAEQIGMPSSNVLRAINLQHNPTLATLNLLLEPFGLQVTVGETPKRRKVAA